MLLNFIFQAYDNYKCKKEEQIHKKTKEKELFDKMANMTWKELYNLRFPDDQNDK